MVSRLKNKLVVSSRWFYKVKQVVDDRRIMSLHYVLTEEQDAEILTKALSKCKFEFHRDRIGVADNPFIVEREC